jgi:hypothetical protein
MTSRRELAAGILDSGEMDAVRYSERIGVARGTVVRWLHDGMPVLRVARKAWINPIQADAWLAARFGGRKTIAFNRESYVYFARAEDGRIKIGWSSDVMRRVHELRKKSRQAVQLVACFPGDKPDELRLHTRFASLCDEGEWYVDNGSIAAFIRSIKAAA